MLLLLPRAACCPKACCPKACSKGVSDVQFMRDLVPFAAEAVGNLTAGALRVDRRRVYATGASNGAFMVNRVGCEAPGLFAAIAPLSGPIANGTSMVWKADPYPCPTPARPVPTLYFHGTKDPLVPFPTAVTVVGMPLNSTQLNSFVRTVKPYYAIVVERRRGGGRRRE